MVRKIDAWETNGVKEIKRLISLPTVSKIEITGVKSHAWPHSKLGQVARAKRS